MRRVSIVVILMLASVLAISCGQKVVEDPAKVAFMTYLPDTAAVAASAGKMVLLDFYTDW